MIEIEYLKCHGKYDKWFPHVSSPSHLIPEGLLCDECHGLIVKSEEFMQMTVYKKGINY